MLSASYRVTAKTEGKDTKSHLLACVLQRVSYLILSATIIISIIQIGKLRSNKII